MFTNKRAIGTLSLGRHVSHTLDQKIQAAAKHGFEAIEIVYTDLEAYAQQHQLSMLDAADRIAALCASLQVEVLSLAPFENFEGAPSPLHDRLQTAKHWIDIARKLQAPYLQVPSQFNRECSVDESVIVSELRQLADLASAELPVVSIAYENLSWGTYCSTWQTVLQLIEAVDRPNFGMCLDSFHEITKLWASPFAEEGKYAGADEALRDSLGEFLAKFPLGKIFYVQLSDGERFNPPFSRDHPWFLEGEAPEFTWSKHARPFPLETELGGYMPVVDVLKAWVLDKGFTGWVSMEVFDWRMRDEKYPIEAAARRAKDSWRKLEMALEEDGRMFPAKF
ncbi:hypothetical protein FE257_008990 [Aspergillus nanangensis]|uniref:Xylose isomerase-like TIM barrel domain-containing protein n=1 Tax=Aspergillus nanangensis TaxID=2582783 RepID=A0AAD4CYA6_ASPNN|nr:hypothetical protein FE257_008990 [Aspergillus nanangensis]